MKLADYLANVVDPLNLSKKSIALGASPQFQKSVDDLAGSVLLGIPLSQAYANTKNLITNPKAEMQRRSDEYAALTPEQRQAEAMNMVFGATLGPNPKSKLTPEFIKRIAPKNAIEESAKKLIEESGGEWRGAIQYPDSPLLLSFNDATGAHGSTMTMFLDELTPENVKKKLVEKAKAYNVKQHPLYEQPQRFDKFLEDEKAISKTPDVIGIANKLDEITAKEQSLAQQLQKTKIESLEKIVRDTKETQAHINSSRVKPKNELERQIKQMVEQNGGVYKGIFYDEAANPLVVNFSDAKLASDLPASLDISALTPEAIKNKINEKAKQYQTGKRLDKFLKGE